MKPDSIRSARIFATRHEWLPFLICLPMTRRISLGSTCQESKWGRKNSRGWVAHHAFQAMRDVDRILVPSIGATRVTASLPSAKYFTPRVTRVAGLPSRANLMSYTQAASMSQSDLIYYSTRRCARTKRSKHEDRKKSDHSPIILPKNHGSPRTNHVAGDRLWWCFIIIPLH